MQTIVTLALIIRHTICDQGVLRFGFYTVANGSLKDYYQCKMADTAKIIIYADSDFKGASREVTNDISRLSDIGFNDRISSIKVIGSVWVGYKDYNFSGRQFILEEGSYSNPGEWKGSHDELSSLQKLPLDIGESPSITVWKDNDYKGKAWNFTYAISNLGHYGFNDDISSMKVKSGIWVLYKDYDYSGRQFVVTEGNYHEPEGWHGSHDEISSLRPVKQPEFPTEVLSMSFDIASGLLNSTPVALANLRQSNNTSLEQAATWTTTQMYTTTTTYEWHWTNATAVKAETTFKTGVPVIADGKITVGITNTFTVGEKNSTLNTQSDTWNVNIPGKVKAGTNLHVQVLIQKGTIDVPFTAVLKKGNKVWKEVGTFKGSKSYNLQVDFTETPL